MVIVGTGENDQILFLPGSSPGQVVATLNGAVVASFIPSGRLIAYGLGGDDWIQVAGGVTVPAWLYGDGGHDQLNAGNAGSLLFGGEGNDVLTGGNGRDVHIGGNGIDTLHSNGNDDILISGSTTEDDGASPTHNAFWTSVLSEWNSGDLLDVRVGKLRLSLLPHVVDDLLADWLNGASGGDWLIANLGMDNVSGKAEAAN
jgi:Ca2+-binding RTX toxin-like protein